MGFCPFERGFVGFFPVSRGRQRATNRSQGQQFTYRPRFHVSYVLPVHAVDNSVNEIDIEGTFAHYKFTSSIVTVDWSRYLLTTVKMSGMYFLNSKVFSKH